MSKINKNISKNKKRSPRRTSVLEDIQAANRCRMTLEGMEVAVGESPMTDTQEQRLAADITNLLTAFLRQQRKEKEI